MTISQIYDKLKEYIDLKLNNLSTAYTNIFEQYKVKDVADNIDYIKNAGDIINNNNIPIVLDNIDSINTLANPSNINAVNVVYSNITDVNTVVNNIDSINSVSNAMSTITNNIDSINTVADYSNITNIGIVASNIDGVNSVANNLAKGANSEILNSETNANIALQNAQLSEQYRNETLEYKKYVNALANVGWANLYVQDAELIVEYTDTNNITLSIVDGELLITYN